jgi:demethylmenaquinone methyltransferase/2-methoxy-6-polyprenyl-1,4-benzoquinol methylase
MSGATPAGTAGEQEAARWVRGMFGRVAHRYDLANRLLSFQMDRGWRRRAVRRVRELAPGPLVLDLCCGTGDLLLEWGAPGFGADFCHPMLLGARRKLARRGLPVRLFEADALSLPLRAGAVDAILIGFGFRNLANYEQGLAEMRRVLRPGGVAAVLEFSQPPHPLFARLYQFYSRRVLPLVGGVLSGARDAYTYLPESVSRFPSPEQLARLMSAAGFRRIEYELLTGGIVALHVGVI